MKRIMAIYDDDPCYADKFAEFINRRPQCPFTAVAFTCAERLQVYAGQQQVTLLLVGSGLSAEALAAIPAELTVRLAKDRYCQSKDTPAVYQYQSADNVLREVIMCYQDLTKECPETTLGTGSEVIGVYSPVNRCGKTGFCLTLGRILANDRRVIFVSLEENSGFSQLTGREHKTCLSDLIYYFKHRKESGFDLNAFVYSLEGLDYVPPVAYGEDLAQLDLQELEQLLKYLAQNGGYDTVIVDFAQFGKGVEQLFSLCSRLYIPVLDDFISRARLDEWQQYLEYSGRGNLWEQMELISLPMQQQTQPEAVLERLLWGETGDYVRQLLKAGEVP